MNQPLEVKSSLHSFSFNLAAELCSNFLLNFSPQRKLQIPLMKKTKSNQWNLENQMCRASLQLSNSSPLFATNSGPFYRWEGGQGGQNPATRVRDVGEWKRLEVVEWPSPRSFTRSPSSCRFLSCTFSPSHASRFSFPSKCFFIFILTLSCFFYLVFYFNPF